MTRYTRAKGSKASNERLPNEATPWHIMKQQLEESKNKIPLEKKKSARELLKDHEDTHNSNTNTNIQEWAELEDNRSRSNTKKHKNSNQNFTKNSKNYVASECDNIQKSQESMSNTKKHKNANLNQNLSKNSKNDVASKDNNEWKSQESKSNTKKHKNSNSNQNLTENSKNGIVSEDNNVQKLQETGDAKIETAKRKTTKIFKKKEQTLTNSNLVASEKELNPRQNSNYVALSKRQKRNRKRKLEMSEHGSKKFKKDISGNIQTREEKLKRKGEYKRRKPENTGVTKIIINGIETEIVMFDGFPVKKEDAERLAELKQTMIMKGIPKSEVDIAMKLERRRAEKALTRIKKLVCFNCRKSGHNLSDCPELDRDEACTGICFKCGSTEHTHFDCKVNKDSTYRYAKCFICREQGHIAMQCPDNPNGMYPHGGCCKICGAVTHLKKDCPDLINAKEQSAVTVEKMDESAVESLQENTKEKYEKESSKIRKNKIIKF